MDNDVYNRASYVVSDTVLKQIGKFTLTDILDIVGDKIRNQFKSDEEMVKYVKNKLNAICEFGLVGRTSIYYFSIP